MKQLSVLSGDVLGTEKMKTPDRRTLQKNLEYLFNRLEGKNELQLSIPFEISRGDGFVGLLQSPAHALRIALLIRSYLKSDFYSGQNLDARIAIGIGTVEFKGSTLVQSDGIAFQHSYTGLRLMQKHPNKIELRCEDEEVNTELNTGLVLVETIVNRLTASQADVIYLKLLGFTEVHISGTLGITQSAVNQRSNAASWNAVETFIERFELVIRRSIHTK